MFFLATLRTLSTAMTSCTDFKAMSERRRGCGFLGDSCDHDCVPVNLWCTLVLGTTGKERGLMSTHMLVLAFGTSECPSTY